MGEYEPRFGPIRSLSPMVNGGSELVIEAGRTERRYWADLWSYRELLYFLSWRDILVRYKQTTIGIAWAVVRPLLTMVVFTVLFGRLADLPSGGTPYPLLVFAAILPWQFFATSLTECSSSLIDDSALISKVYFPRLLVPLGTVMVSLVDLAISGVILVGLMGWYRFVPPVQIVTLPVFVLFAFLVSIGAGLWFAALNVKYRDFRYVVPFMVQMGLYISPVGFSSEVVPETWRILYYLNPMVGVIDGFRWAILGERAPLYLPGLALSVVLVGATLAGGIRYFRKTERSFADLI